MKYYRPYKCIDGYTSESVRKYIHDHNKEHPFAFIFENYVDVYEDIKIGEFDSAEEVLNFENTPGFIEWVKYKNITVEKKSESDFGDIFVYYIHIDKEYTPLLVPDKVYDLSEFKEKYPDTEIFSFAEYLTKWAEHSPCINNELSSSISQAFDDIVDAYENEKIVNLRLYDPNSQDLSQFPKNTKRNDYSIKYAVLTDEGYIASAGCFYTGDIRGARQWDIEKGNIITDYMYLFHPNIKYTIIPKITIHSLLFELNTDDMIKNINILKQNYESI